MRWCDAVLVAEYRYYPRMSSDHSTETNQIRNGFPSDPGPGEPEAAARSPASSSNLPLAGRHRVRRDVLLFAHTEAFKVKIMKRLSTLSIKLSSAKAEAECIDTAISPMSKKRGTRAGQARELV